MAQPASRSELIAYCKRQLGAPVLEINVADEQIDDLVDDALLLDHFCFLQVAYYYAGLYYYNEHYRADY